MPEYFGRDPNVNHDTLKPYLLCNGDSDQGICTDFIEEALSRTDEDDTILPIFTGAMSLVTYARYPKLLEALAQEEKFLVTSIEGMTREQLAVSSEERTILGPFFRISPLQTEVTKSYFSGPRTIDAGHKKSAQTALQMTLKAHQGDLTAIINAFVRVKEARSKVLDWFAFIFNTNHKRRALQVKPNEVASDGFMVNVTAILDQLCQPFMDNTFSKVSKIDVDYLRRNPRIEMGDETKLNADQATADAFYGREVGGESNFISEIFFLTLAAHHYGLGATNSKLKELDREIKHVEGAIKQIEDQMAKIQGRQYQAAVQAVEKAIALKFSIEGVVLDQGMQTLSLQFMRYVSVWLLRVASGGDYAPGRPFKLPLSPTRPEAFSCLPEYALQDVVDNFKFVFRFVPQILISAVGEEIITLCITFLRSSEYIKNPYLKSSLVTLLFSGTWPIYHLKRGVLGDALAGSDFANEHLLHALMKCGVSSAFYDKFNIRYEIFQVIKCIWANTVYQEQLSRESKVNKQFFVQFVNLLLNDATFLLDEALTKLYKIHDYQKQLRDQSLSPQDREKVTSDLESAEQLCQNWMQLLNDTMAMMKLFTAALRDAFTMPEIVTRLAGMLDYNLEVLVGPRRANLKVEDPKKYHFDAKTLLAEFIDIYLNLGSAPTFVAAIAGDGRSYKPSNFEKASQILSANLNAAPETAAAWDSLRHKIAEAKGRLDQAELDLGEIPEEFEDPLLGDLMTDPVILPSRNIVDRSTIIQQLLSNPLDPFTRAPMKIEDVVPADDLRTRIETWKAGRIAEAKAKASGDLMDTSAG
ncbi:putative ubiquitin conjugation factor e4 protein [Eutypa lata UCREL1]|uniref:Putative ubiquitin conjugation factor e4 protein n=1 Tax=Eutypa lata (strain UCR-EL1) TaxID=1287681 RepID=M7SMC2_EUTLA|nr:putative ubiquitin conjugation factor e4 protein [Eutypa lata UCREL1]